MTPTNNYIWKDINGVELDMMQMDEKHLQYAHTHACIKEFKYHELSGFFSDKRDQLEEVAKLRKIELSFPDEAHPSKKWGNYFCNIRKTKAVVPVLAIRQPLMKNYKGLEQVNILD
jgi:hypothetical protein